MHPRTNIARRLLACGVAAGAIAVAGQALAADAAAAPPTVQEVVVTANKTAEKLHDVAMGVTALGGNKLDTEQNVSFQDYAALVPGLSLQSDGPGTTRVTLRGLNAGGDGSTVAVYIDETPFGSSNGLANGGVTTGDFETWDLQRVEVLRGPQGTLYGASTEGGLIKFVTNAPDPHAFSAAAEVGGEDVAHGQDGFSVKGMINLPLWDGKAALRVSGYDDSQPGFINDPQLGLKDVNGGNKYGVRASFLYKPTDTLSIRLSAVSQLQRAGDGPNVDVVGAPLVGAGVAPPANQLSPANGGLNQNQYIHGYIKDRMENYAATVNWNPGPVSVTSTTSFGILKLSTLGDATSTEAAPGVTYGEALSAPPAYGGFGVPVGLDEVQLTGLHKFTQEVRIASAPGKLEWQIGGFYTRESTVIDQTLNAFDVPSGAAGGLPALGGGLLTSVYKEWAGFGEVTYHFLPQFDVAVGGRWSTNTQSASVGTLAGALTGPTSAFPIASNGSDFTWSVAPRWHVSKDTLVYARFATGYRPGGPNDVPTSVKGVPLTYQPDSTMNYEVGVRTSLLNNMVSVDVAAFYIDWTQIQLLETVGLYTVDGNGGNARSDGVEWTLGFYPIRGLTFTLTGAYTDAVLTSLNPLATIQAKVGDQLPFVPKVSTSLDGQYEWPAFKDYNAFVGGTVSYLGDRVTTFSGSPLLAGDVDLPAYTTVALRAGLQNDRWRFEVYGKNLGDVRGINDYSSSGAPNLEGTITIIQPLTIGVLLSRKFF